MDGALFTTNPIEPQAVLQLEEKCFEVPGRDLPRPYQLLQGLYQSDLEAGLEATQLAPANLH